MMSGLLTSYSFYKQLEHKKRLDIPREYVSRLMRYSNSPNSANTNAYHFINTFCQDEHSLSLSVVNATILYPIVFLWVTLR